jgi:hypothetical protein
VHAARVEEKDDFPFCLTFSDDNDTSASDANASDTRASGGDVMLQVHVESKNINTSSRQFVLTSATIKTAAAPPLIDWDAVRRLNKQVWFQLKNVM